MGILDSLTLGKGKDAAKENVPKKEINYYEVNTSLCRFARSIQEQLSQPLRSEDPTLSSLDWYTAACSEVGPTTSDLEVMEKYNKELRKFDKGSFSEFRILRVLEELQQAGEIDQVYTTYQMPKIGISSLARRDPIHYARQDVLTGKNIELDAFKMDALVLKKLTNGSNVFLPIQTKFRVKRKSRSGGINLDKRAAASLRKKYPHLKSCFDNLQLDMQTLHVRNNFVFIALGDNFREDHVRDKIHPTKSKTELKAEICESLAQAKYTFVTQDSFEQLRGMAMLEQLLDCGLFEGAPTHS